MTNDDRERQHEADAQIEREIRQGRKLTAVDLMSHLAGPGAMKGASPVSPVQQAETEIATWLGTNLDDAGGALKAVLHRHLKGSALLYNHLDRPLAALASYCRSLVAADRLLREIVGEADVEWGRQMAERPHFERDGAAPHPDDPYTFEGVRRTLDKALRLLPDENG